MADLPHAAMLPRSQTMELGKKLTVVAVVGLLGLHFVINSGVNRGQGSSYTYTVEVIGPDIGGNFTYEVDIDILDPDNDFSDYKAESDARIDAWVANPQSAPVLDGRPVRVTFLSPKSYSDTMQIVGSSASQFLTHGIVGFSQSEPEIIVDGVGPINPADIGQVPNPACGVAVDAVGMLDPAACEPVTNTGVMDVMFTLSGGLTSLAALKAHSDVFLIDTTGIVVLDAVAGQGVNMSNIQAFVLPWAMYDSATTWP
jgi:hypothetical protein